MEQPSVNHRALRHTLMGWYFEKRQTITKSFPRNSFLRTVTKYVTTAILISTIAVAIGVLVDRGMICVGK